MSQPPIEEGVVVSAWIDKGCAAGTVWYGLSKVIVIDLIQNDSWSCIMQFTSFKHVW